MEKNSNFERGQEMLSETQMNALTNEISDRIDRGTDAATAINLSLSKYEHLPISETTRAIKILRKRFNLPDKTIFEKEPERNEVQGKESWTDRKRNQYNPAGKSEAEIIKELENADW